MYTLCRLKRHARLLVTCDQVGDKNGWTLPKFRFHTYNSIPLSVNDLIRSLTGLTPDHSSVYSFTRAHDSSVAVFVSSILDIPGSDLPPLPPTATWLPIDRFTPSDSSAPAVATDVTIDPNLAPYAIAVLSSPPHATSAHPFLPFLISELPTLPTDVVPPHPPPSTSGTTSAASADASQISTAAAATSAASPPPTPTMGYICLRVSDPTAGGEAPPIAPVLLAPTTMPHGLVLACVPPPTPCAYSVARSVDHGALLLEWATHIARTTTSWDKIIAAAGATATEASDTATTTSPPGAGSATSGGGGVVEASPAACAHVAAAATPGTPVGGASWGGCGVAAAAALPRRGDGADGSAVCGGAAAGAAGGGTAPPTARPLSTTMSVSTSEGSCAACRPGDCVCASQTCSVADGPAVVGADVVGVTAPPSDGPASATPLSLSLPAPPPAAPSVYPLSQATLRRAAGVGVGALQLSLLDFSAAKHSPTAPLGSDQAHVAGRSGAGTDGEVRVTIAVTPAACDDGTPLVLLDQDDIPLPRNAIVQHVLTRLGAGEAADAMGGGARPDALHVHVHCEPLPPLSAARGLELRAAARSDPTAKALSWVRERASLTALMRADVTDIVLVGKGGDADGAHGHQRSGACDDDSDGPDALPDLSADLGHRAVGHLLEGTQSNFYVVDAVTGALTTAGSGVLEGTVRKVVIDVCHQLGIPVVLRAPRCGLGREVRWAGAAVSSTSRLLLPADVVYAPRSGERAVDDDAVWRQEWVTDKPAVGHATGHTIFSPYGNRMRIIAAAVASHIKQYSERP